MAGNKVFEIPDHLADWARTHPRVMHHLQDALRMADAPFTEKQLWNLIASTYSPEWSQANARLQHAEQKLATLRSPENTPLGLIGAALDGVTITSTKDEQISALAEFTVIDETLRLDDDLQKLLKELVAQQQRLEVSLGISRSVRDLHAVFEKTALSKNAKPHALAAWFGKLSRKPPTPFK